MEAIPSLALGSRSLPSSDSTKFMQLWQNGDHFMQKLGALTVWLALHLNKFFNTLSDI